ncbi:MAG: TonB family protein [Bacteroidales bacterium]|nr:TonB family protein [Bacteroidales bacterium]
MYTGVPALKLEPALALINNPVPETNSIDISWQLVLLIMYFSGFLILFGRNLFFLLRLKRVWKNSGNKNSGIAFTADEGIFTLFSKIFLPDKFREITKTDPILLHERAHILQLHYIDLILVEFTLLFTWFNPFSWLISKMIRENHEQLADRSVLSAGVNTAQYQAQLLNQTLGVQVFRLGNQFNFSLTKNRFEMMKRKKSWKSGVIKVIILVPAILFTLGFITGTNGQEGTLSGRVFLAENQPAQGASIVIKDTYQGTVSDRDGNFSLKIKKNDEVVFSYVGYETLFITPEIGQMFEVILQLKSYEIKPDKTNSKNKSVKNIESEITIDETRQVTQSDSTYFFFIVEEMPEYPGGENAFIAEVQNNLEYPAEAKLKKIEGKVFVQFIVNEEGDITNLKIIRSSNDIFNDTAIDAIKNTQKWKPGKQRGKNVPVQFTFPVIFKVNN